jgi:hypothetical protein
MRFDSAINDLSHLIGRWNSASSKSEAKGLLRFNWPFCAGLEAMARSIAFRAAALLPWRRHLIHCRC